MFVRCQQISPTTDDERDGLKMTRIKFFAIMSIKVASKITWDADKKIKWFWIGRENIDW